MGNLKWYGAFHNEGHHPHIHMIIYSTNPKEGYLSKKGVENIRSSLAKDIFADDLYSVYEKQTEHRDNIRADSREIIKDIVSKINSGSYDNARLENLIMQLADKLSKTSGKKIYGYLKSDVKNIVDEIVKELSKDENISRLYDLWYEQRENIIRTYTDELPERIAIVDNKEFKSIKNSVIQEVLKISLNGAETENLYVSNSSLNDNGGKSLAFVSAKLLKSLSKIIQSRIQTNDDKKQDMVDRKLMSKIEEKKMAQGLH